MSPEAYLTLLGWKWADVGETLGVHRNTLTAWRSGKVPGYVIAYLDLAVRHRELLDSVRSFADGIEDLEP